MNEIDWNEVLSHICSGIAVFTGSFMFILDEHASGIGVLIAIFSLIASVYFAAHKKPQLVDITVNPCITCQLMRDHNAKQNDPS